MESMIEPFIFACGALNNRQVVEEFISRYGANGLKINLMDGSNGFLCACQENNIEIVKLLVEAGYEIDFKNIYGSTGFMKACYYKHYDIIDYLLHFDVDVNAQNNAGRTALMEGTCIIIVVLHTQSLLLCLLTSLSKHV